jgi:hypothetical protein
MKQNFTLKRIFRKKEGWLLMALFALLLVFGCYEFKLVDQPTEATTNSSFDVNIVMTEDDDDSNDWSYEDGSLTKGGLFAVLLPEGWTIHDSAEVHVVALDSLPDGQGGWVFPSQDHGGDYLLLYDETQTTMLNDSAAAPPEGYYWWGAVSNEPVDMAFFDSLYYTLNIMTDDKTGEFYLQYAVGDVDYWGRMPYDPETLTDPLPITISQGVNVEKYLQEDALSLYPSPSYGYLNIGLSGYSGQQVHMMIYDLRGKQVMSGQITASHTTLDLTGFAPGTYVLRLETDGEAVTRKFVKK